MFPALDVGTIDLAKCRRIVLLHRQPATADEGEKFEVQSTVFAHAEPLLQLRHYAITVQHTGVAKGVRKLMKGKLPDLSRLEDIADFLDA